MMSVGPAGRLGVVVAFDCVVLRKRYFWRKLIVDRKKASEYFKLDVVLLKFDYTHICDILI